MISVSPQVITLQEYVPVRLPAADFSEESAKILAANYADHIAVTPPSFQNNHQWELTNQGWAGHIPLTETLHLKLEPKVEIGNLFRMLEVAYQLESFKWLAGITHTDALDDLYERLANILAQRILARGRKGFYRAYVSEAEDLPYLRGQLDTNRRMRRPWAVDLPCCFQEHTADVDENRILTWTLHRIARSGICTERVLPTVRRAYRSLLGATTLTPFDARTCIDRLYNRLNDDYQPLHGLCRFFLEQQGASHKIGERVMLPFVVNMPRLFELFVANWLQAHLPEGYRLRQQENVIIDEANGLRFVIDMVIYHRDTGRAEFVLDTKYKTPNQPSAADTHQAIAYAHTKTALQAVLIYPRSLRSPLNTDNRGIQLRSTVFALDGDLEAAGQEFLAQLFKTSGERL